MKTYSYNGITLSAKEWSVKLKISRDAFYQRLTDFKAKEEIFKAGYKRKPTRRNQFHGKSGSPEYNSWADMLKRCTNPKNRKWHRYGGRGIKVCDRWLQFDNFYSDMGNRPKGTTLDRKDNDGNYCKNNCRWATPKQQGNNKSTTLFLKYKDKILPSTEMAAFLGITHAALRQRLSRQRHGGFDYGLVEISGGTKHTLCNKG